MAFNEYRQFGFVSKLKMAQEIKLLTRIFNRGIRKENLSLVFATTDNQVYGYGHNDSGCLGLASAQALHKAPALIKPLCGKTLVKICSGNRFVVALTDTGKCYSWGDNKFGQLGHGKNVAAINKPMLIEALKSERVLDVSCGQFHVLVLTDGGDVYAFGSNVSGAIGNGTTFHQSSPVKLTDLAESNFLVPDVVAVVAGGWHSACVNRKGELLVWGWNEHGQCNFEDTKANQVVPRRVLLPSAQQDFPCTNAAVKSVQCGLHHTLALTFEGTVFAFGSNEFGECAHDIATTKMCPTAVRVDLGEPILQIGALSQSRLSLARSQLHFYVWGQCKANAAQGHIPRKVSISQQVQRSLSFNPILARNEQHEFCLEVNSSEALFPSTVMITKLGASNQSNGSLGQTFNDPNESDTVLLFGSPTAPPVRVIFVQKTVLDCYSNFLVEFSKRFPVSSNPMPLDDGPTPSKQRRNAETDDTKLAQVLLTVARNKRKFSQLIISEVQYEVLYAYLFYIYSDILLVEEDRLVETMQLCHRLGNDDLLRLCLHHVERHFDIDQLCCLYKYATEARLDKVCHFCQERAQVLLMDKEVSFRLFNDRQSADVALTFTEPDGSSRTIRAHRLVLALQCRLYETLFALLKQPEQSTINAELAKLNPVLTMNDLMAAESIHLGALFSESTLQLYLHFVYCQTEPSDEQLTIAALVKLFTASQVLGEDRLGRLCLEHLKKRVTVDNACHLYAAHSANSEHRFVVDLCLDAISQNLAAFHTSADYGALLAEPTRSLLVQALNRDLAKYLRQKMFSQS